MGLATMTGTSLLTRTNLSFIKQKMTALAFTAVFANHSYADLTEPQAIELGMQNPQITELWQAQKDKSLGEAKHAGRFANPSIEFSQESLELPTGDSDEKTLWLRQPIDIAGVKRLERKAAQKLASAQDIEQLLTARRWQQHLRESFYQTLAAQEKLVLIKNTQTRLATLYDHIVRRAERGDASQFDALRLGKERAVIANRHATAEANFTRLQAKLLNDTQATHQLLVGQLMPEYVATSAISDDDLLSHPQMQAIALSLQSAELRARAAGREHWPDITLGVGRKEVEDPAFSAEGNAISLEVSLPIFNHGGAEKRIAAGATRELRAQLALAHQQLKTEFQSAASNLKTHLNAAKQFKLHNTPANLTLSKLAGASYHAGEINIMELLDAYQAELETSEYFIDTALAARLAYIQLQYLKGE